MTISILEAAKHIGARSHWSLSNLKMQKLLYIAHMFYLGIYNKPLVHEFFEAWDYGPVHPDLYHYAKVYGADPVGNIFNSIHELKDEETDISILDAVEEQLGKLSGAHLIAITHREDGAWAKNYRPGAKGVIIPNSDIIDEYRLRQSIKNEG